jgi:5-methylcytosine-specific restriction endonuclease McrA
MAKVEAKRAERIDGEKRRCRRCGLWKHESKFSRVPNGTRRQTCAACYSRAQIVRDKKAGIKRDFAGIDLLSWQEAVRELGGRCAYCVTAVATERDHIIPVSKGGPTELWNLTLACGACNRRKRNILGYFPKLTHSFMRPRDAYPTPKPE